MVARESHKGWRPRILEQDRWQLRPGDCGQGEIEVVKTKATHCLLQWKTPGPTSDGVDRHECIRFKDHVNDHVCYCGQSISQKKRIRKDIT